LSTPYQQWREMNEMYEELKDGERTELPMAGGCGENCQCAQAEREEIDETSFSNNAEFVKQFSSALHMYLDSQYGKDTKSHMEDLAASTSNFAEAFYATACYFS